MTLAPGAELGRYEIRSKIGEGGMGEVYRAFDPKIGREVAIKVLPAELAENKERVARFEQEAQAAGALNHPNILAIYDVDTQDNILYVVSELLEGEELRDRLEQGPISVRKAIEYAQQIVSGLSATHEKGIVHRDLKPENLFITKDERVKILDFGIAKLTTSPRSANTDISEDATRKVLTNPGMVIGTVGYMSPEQVRGQPADHRADIFSFGAILHEMITGRRAFRRETMAETMTAILKEEPEDLSASNPNINPSLEKIVNRCLEKKPERRFQSTADLGFALEALSPPISSSGRDLTTAASAAITEAKKSTWRVRLPWLITGGVVLLAVTALVWAFLSRSSSTDGKAIRLSFNPPANLLFNDGQVDAAVIAPDGQKIAFTATSADGKNTLYVRNLDSGENTVLPGSDNALEPFWSPDSRFIAYGSDGKLKRSDLSGGNAQILCDAARLVGGSWSASGVIVFQPDYRLVLMQVPAGGGEPQPLPMNSNSAQDERQINPIFLADGRKFLFRRGVGGVSKGIWVGSLDSPETTQVVPDSGQSPFAVSREGWLIFVRNDALVAQALDSNGRVSGESIPIISGQRNALGNVRRFSVSDNGILVWQGQWQREYQLVWFDRTGKQVGVVETPTKVSVGQDPQISPDGKRLLIKRFPDDGSINNIWVVDLEKGTSLRITSNFSQMPIWSPDGNRIAYNCDWGICIKAANGIGEAEQFYAGTNFTSQWSPDGRFILFVRRGVKTRMDMYALSVNGERKETLLLNSAADEACPLLSPDGKWLAYASDETGTYEIYVQSFSDGKLGPDRKRISTTGGRFPVWRRDGTELCFIAQDAQLMSTPVKTSGTEFSFETPKPLFKTRIMNWNLNFHELDISPDGQRLLIGTVIGEPTSPPPTVILNWTAALKR
jgi:serine/threonine protein kinase